MDVDEQLVLREAGLWVAARLGHKAVIHDFAIAWFPAEVEQVKSLREV